MSTSCDTYQYQYVSQLVDVRRTQLSFKAGVTQISHYLKRVGKKLKTPLKSVKLTESVGKI